MARRRRNGGDSEPGFLGGIKEKFSTILGKLQSISDFSKPPAVAPAKKQEQRDSPEAFAAAVQRIVEQGYFKHLSPYVKGGEAKPAVAAPTPTGNLPTPKNAPSATTPKAPPAGPTHNQGRSAGAPPASPVTPPLPNWLQYQVSLSQNAPAAPKPPAGPRMPKSFRRGAKLGAGLRTAGAHLGRALHPTGGASSLFSNASAAAKAAGGGLGAIGGAAGAVGGAVSAAAAPVALIGGLVTATEKLRTWTHHLHESNIQFAEFSASMTRVEVESQIRNIMLSRERGERRAASAQYLSEQSDALSRTLAPIEDFASVIKNRLLGGLSEVAVGFFEMGKKLTGFNVATGAGADTGQGRDYVREFMKDLAVEAWHEKYGRPAKFNNAGGGGISGADFGGRDF